MPRVVVHLLRVVAVIAIVAMLLCAWYAQVWGIARIATRDEQDETLRQLRVINQRLGRIETQLDHAGRQMDAIGADVETIRRVVITRWPIEMPAARRR